MKIYVKGNVNLRASMYALVNHKIEPILVCFLPNEAYNMGQSPSMYVA